MSNVFEDTERAVRDAEYAQRAVDANTAAMVRLLAGRLRAGTRSADYKTAKALAELKVELRDFNAVTMRWGTRT